MEKTSSIFPTWPLIPVGGECGMQLTADKSHDSWDLLQVGMVLAFGICVWLLRTLKARLGSDSQKIKRLTMQSDSNVAEHRGYRVQDVEDVLRIACKENLVGLEAQPVAMFYDMDAMKETLLELRTAFPSHFTHCIAVKSNPLPCFLRFAIQMGFGLEAASLGEFMLALREGCDPSKVLFDCPAKSRHDIRKALSQHVNINANSVQELERIDEERAALAATGVASASRVGIRINPLVGLGSIAALSVSGKRSKFGVAMTAEGEESVLECFRKFRWLVGIHVHVGSQGCSMQQHAAGARRAVTLAQRIQAEHGEGRIETIDIGGGLPVNFDSAAVSPTFAQYSAVLRGEVPELFAGQWTVFTEYGRSVSAKAGFVACAVEYTTAVEEGREVAVVQAGADLFMRTCYARAAFPMRISAHNPNTGALMAATPPSADGKDGAGAAGVAYDVVGPLCFAGDVLAEDLLFPQLKEGDVLVVHDAGANTLALWSRHCSRLAPPVFGYFRPRSAVPGGGGLAASGTDRGGREVAVMLLKGPEELDDLWRFWEPTPAAPAP